MVVGYDDNKSYDVNRNGIIEECEKGAFKIANSWGEDFGSGGYAWVLYDALNKETTIPGNWEGSLPGERVSAFVLLEQPTIGLQQLRFVTIKLIM